MGVLDRIMSKSNLLIIGLICSPSRLVCSFCSGTDENLLYMLFSCPLSREVWSRITSWVGIGDKMEENLAENFLKWFEFFKSNKVRKGNEGNNLDRGCVVYLEGEKQIDFQ